MSFISWTEYFMYVNAKRTRKDLSDRMESNSIIIITHTYLRKQSVGKEIFCIHTKHQFQRIENLKRPIIHISQDQ